MSALRSAWPLSLGHSENPLNVRSLWHDEKGPVSGDSPCLSGDISSWAEMETKLEREDEVVWYGQDRGSRTSSQQVSRNRPEMQKSREREGLERKLQGSACEDRDMRTERAAVPWVGPYRREFHEA